MKQMVLALFLVTLILMAGCKTTQTAKKSQIANPASVYCIDQGGVLDIRTNEDGSQSGYCIFDDGSECEEWAFYRGECEK